METIQQTSNKVARNLRLQERKLKQLLESFYLKHIKGSNAPIQTIRQKYNQEVKDIILNNIQISWFYSVVVMEESIGVKLHTTTNDVQGIERITEQQTNQFWETARKNLEREHEFKINKGNELEQKPEYQLPAAMVGVSSFMVYLAFNEGIKSKTQEIDNQVLLRFTTRRDERVDPSLCKPLEGKIYGHDEFVPSPPLHKHCRCTLIPIAT